MTALEGMAPDIFSERQSKTKSLACIRDSSCQNQHTSISGGASLKANSQTTTSDAAQWIASLKRSLGPSNAGVSTAQRNCSKQTMMRLMDRFKT